ncbi:MAG TPA: helix-turn-helix domain-containing protein [Acidimicrobiales bacterium]
MASRGSGASSSHAAAPTLLASGAGPDPAMAAPVRPRRAAPLSAPERRAAIVAATVPLLRLHGMAVTTRQIAEAAGVAEGTIFSVFPDKDALLAEALDAAFDPEPTRARLAAIDLSGPLDERLVIAVEIVQGHLSGVWQLLSAVGPETVVAKGGSAPRTKPGNVFDSKELAALFEPASAQLRLDPSAAAQALIGLTLAGTHPIVVGVSPLPAAQIVSLLLDGIRCVPDPGTRRNPPTGVRP